MKPIPFFKMSGSGNDFILIDNREAIVPEESLHKLIVGACRRKLSVGADGLILIEPSKTVDFKWRFFNADGSEGEMCGNGARCAARFACLNGIAGSQLAFETIAGIIQADVGEHTVKLRMTDPGALTTGIELDLDEAPSPLQVSSINTGVPHVVAVVEDVDPLDVFAVGRRIRHHNAFAPSGTNVNFVAMDASGKIKIRTYERGVEDETLACGTGNVAAAITLAHSRGITSPVTLNARGGRLTVHFSRDGERYRDVYLEGNARVIYEGKLWEEAWQA